MVCVAVGGFCEWFLGIIKKSKTKDILGGRRASPLTILLIVAARV